MNQIRHTIEWRRTLPRRQRQYGKVRTTGTEAAWALYSQAYERTSPHIQGRASMMDAAAGSMPQSTNDGS